MLGLYVFTGKDVTSAFKGKGKVGPLKKLQNHPRYHVAFTCLMYGHAREKSAILSVVLC